MGTNKFNNFYNRITASYKYVKKANLANIMSVAISFIDIFTVIDIHINTKNAIQNRKSQLINK